ncbi:MAG: cryptochrome/photolyase family protein [Deinococcales bacterium]
MQHVLVLGDQLNLHAIRLLQPERVLMLESIARGAALPYHKQKLLLLYSAMRHFRLELEQAGFAAVTYLQCQTFEDGLRDYLKRYPNAEIAVLQPAEWGIAARLERAVRKYGGSLRVLPNPLWLSSQADWERYAKGKKTFRMEFFYRQMRQKTGWLMNGEAPLGGKWNFDAENRQVPPKGHRFPPKLEFAPDELTRQTARFVEEHFASHFGSLEHFNYAVTRADALRALEHFLEHRLHAFGAFEDALVDGENQLYHSLLSPYINLGLLSPREVCEAALTRLSQVPLASLEGFIRQILGWREFMYHVYHTLMPEFRELNQFKHTRPLPEFYWTGQSKMRCVSQAVRQVWTTGHAHHIQRLMVLGNFALLYGVRPQEINEWFLLGFVDAFDWVVTPNVIGMSQYADGGVFTSKPYVSGAGYINRMSDHCQQCVFHPKETTGEDACPFNSLYWNFIDQNLEHFAKNPRMAIVVANWRKRNLADKNAILEQAQKYFNYTQRLV